MPAEQQMGKKGEIPIAKSKETVRPQCGENGRELNQIKRLERRCLILWIIVLLLGFLGIRLAIQLRSIIEVLDFVTQRLDLISEQVDAVSQCIQGFS